MPSNKIPRWKYWLSNFWDLPLDRVHSDINGEISLYLSNGRLKLMATECIYSYDDLYTNFSEALYLLKDEIQQVESVLVLGMGTASVPYIIEKQHNINCRFDLVEIDPAVIEIASRFAIPRLDSTINVIEADAYAFVLQSSRKYDLIVFDIFIDDLIPAKFEERLFLEKLLVSKNNSGLILWNRLYRNADDQKETERFFRDAIQSINTEAYYLEVEGNWIIVA